MDESNVAHCEMTIEADPAAVFAFFTDPKRLVRWMGASATLEPHPGGLMLIDVQGRFARGKYTEVVPVTHLAYTFGWDGSETVPPGSSLVEIELVPQNGGTLVRLNHTGLPPAAVAAHREGWTHYLGRLATVATGQDPGPDWRRV